MTAPSRIAPTGSPWPPWFKAAARRVGIWFIDMFARLSRPTAAAASLHQAPMTATPPASAGERQVSSAALGSGQVMEQPVTGFVPSDMNEMAPDHLTDVVESFKAPAPAPPAVRVDPIGQLTDDELHAQDEEKERIRKAQRDGDALLGAYRRR
jgi:hypothetical protein